MKSWGLAITVFYALVVALLLVPLTFYFGADVDGGGWVSFIHNIVHLYGAWFMWLFIAVFIFGEGLLLFLRVDTSRRRLKPRTHMLVSSVTSAFFLGLLTFLGVLGVGVALGGDKVVPDRVRTVVTAIAVAWVFWTIVFYRRNRNSEDIVSRGVNWLMRGSVLELLIAVPAHVIVRRRNNCSAPMATSFGITTGIAVMLLAFGPSVLLLYKQRLEQYSTKVSAGK